MQIWMAGRNITTLETMKKTFSMIPDNKYPNPFDMGVFTNISLFF